MRHKTHRTFGDIEREWERKNDLPDYAKDEPPDWVQDELRNQCEQDAQEQDYEAKMQERADNLDR